MDDEKNQIPLDEGDAADKGDIVGAEKTPENQGKTPFQLNIENLDEDTKDEDSNTPLITGSEKIIVGNTHDDVSTALTSDEKKKKKKKHGWLFNTIYALCIVAVSILIAWFILIVINDMSGITKPDTRVDVEIKKGAKTSQIADVLHKNGMIDMPLVFLIYLKITKVGNFQYGLHNMNKNMGYSEIVKELKRPPLNTKDQISITFPEGFTVEQIAEKLEDKKICDRAAFITACDGVFNYDFIKELPINPNRIRRLEGYLFPDTYFFYINDSPDSVVKKFLDNFKNHISAQMLADMKAQGLTYDKLITLASIVQTEGLDSDVMPDVASVFYNRLNNPNQFPYLQSDATVLYVMPKRKVWLNSEDISNPSPYNSYKFKGLPPGPICNPGLDAINATIHPTVTQYFFFVTDSKNKYYFSKTLAEHEKYVSKIKSNDNKAHGTTVAQ